MVFLLNQEMYFKYCWINGVGTDHGIQSILLHRFYISLGNHSNLTRNSPFLMFKLIGLVFIRKLIIVILLRFSFKLLRTSKFFLNLPYFLRNSLKTWNFSLLNKQGIIINIHSRCMLLPKYLLLCLYWKNDITDISKG